MLYQCKSRSAEVLGNNPDVKKFGRVGADLDTAKQALVQLISSVKFRLARYSESEGKKVRAGGVLCPAQQAFVIT